MRHSIAVFFLLASACFAADPVVWLDGQAQSSPSSSSGGGGDVYAASNNASVGVQDLRVGTSGVKIAQAQYVDNDAVTNHNLVGVSNGSFYGSFTPIEIQMMNSDTNDPSAMYIHDNRIYTGGGTTQLKITLILDDVSTLSGPWAVDSAYDDEYGNRIARQGWVSNKIFGVTANGVSATNAVLIDAGAGTFTTSVWKFANGLRIE